MKLEKLLVVAANRCRDGGRDDRRLQVRGRVSRLGPTAHEELVIDVLRWERVQGKPGIAAKVSALGRPAQDVGPQSTPGNDGAERVNARAAVRPHRREEPERRS